jgi:Dolichyl-phosphate-mannose-protein mannosyltransferase
LSAISYRTVRFKTVPAFVWKAFFISLTIKLVLAHFVELNNDEAYYYAYAQKLQWSYFDHPPGVAILIRLFTADLHFTSELFMRLGPLVCNAVSLFLTYSIGKKIGNEQTGVISAMLFLASPYASIIAGFLVMPDAPMLSIWLATVFASLRIADNESKIPRLYFCLIGCLIGIATLCKVHSIFLWIGVMLFIIHKRPELLKRGWLYAGMFITLLVISPILYWNWQNNFVTYSYHSGRVSLFTTIRWWSVGREIFGEILYHNPLNWILIALAFLHIRKLNEGPKIPMLLWLAAPLIITVWFLSLFRDTLRHWSGPAFVTLFPIAALYIERTAILIKSSLPFVVRCSLMLHLLMLSLALVFVEWLPLEWGRDKKFIGKGDPTLDMTGFANFADQFDSLRRQDRLTFHNRYQDAIVVDYWFPAGHFNYYIGRESQIPVLGLGPVEAIHHFKWLNEIRQPLEATYVAYFISVSNYNSKPPEQLRKMFPDTLRTRTIPQYKAGRVVRNFIVYGFKKDARLASSSDRPF